MRLALNLGLELRTLADRAISDVAANRSIDDHIRSPSWLPQAGRGTEPRNNRSFLKSWKLNGSGQVITAPLIDFDLSEKLAEFDGIGDRRTMRLPMLRKASGEFDIGEWRGAIFGPSTANRKRKPC